ncbi:hypothetical protein LPN04_29550 [Rugamonas sp. A1-17]|nr:hypothetical protein [Rugamonas sp. A1-17]
MHPITTIIIGAAVTFAGLWIVGRAQRSLKELKMKRKSERRMQAMFPGMRSLPLTKADRRGWVTDRDGNIVPR